MFCDTRPLVKSPPQEALRDGAVLYANYANYVANAYLSAIGWLAQCFRPWAATALSGHADYRSRMFLAPPTFTSPHREMYASGGGLLVPP